MSCSLLHFHDSCFVQAEEEGANVDLDSQRKGKCAVVKTSTRQVVRMLISLSYCQVDALVLGFD
jgi:hypothetical protein